MVVAEEARNEVAVAEVAENEAVVAEVTGNEVLEEALAVIPRRRRTPSIVVRRLSRRNASILAKQKIATIFEVEEEEGGAAEL